MKSSLILPTWAPRVKPYRVRRLYESDAQGLLDPDLVDDVGWALYSRCDSFIAAIAARKGRVLCPVCKNVVLDGEKHGALLRCSACGWECPYRAYMDTIKNAQLNGGPEVVGLFQEYLDRFPKAKEPPEKMLLIDGLIHGFHHFLGSGRVGRRRPVGINLLDGHLEFVILFLDRLTYGPGSTPGLEETRDGWREKIKESTNWG
jgi:predicted RNA-binding Zn-ribbon protein involved in translation (DUF1610 family)